MKPFELDRRSFLRRAALGAGGLGLGNFLPQLLGGAGSGRFSTSGKAKNVIWLFMRGAVSYTHLTLPTTPYV